MRVPYSYSRNAGTISLAVSAGLSFLAGARGWGLVLFTALGFVPIGMILGVIQRYWFPPTLEIVDESD
jgi:hypothetical protein